MDDWMDDWRLEIVLPDIVTAIAELGPDFHHCLLVTCADGSCFGKRRDTGRWEEIRPHWR